MLQNYFQFQNSFFVLLGYEFNGLKIVGGMNANGTAIGAVNVTGAAGRLKVPVASKERVPVASHHGAIFANPGERNKCILYN
jgi:hypothetical protein